MSELVTGFEYQGGKKAIPLHSLRVVDIARVALVSIPQADCSVFPWH